MEQMKAFEAHLSEASTGGSDVHKDDISNKAVDEPANGQKPTIRLKKQAEVQQVNI